MSVAIVKCPACKNGLKINKTSNNQPIVCGGCQYRSVASEFLPVTLKKITCPQCKSAFAIDAEYQGDTTCSKCAYKGNIAAFRAPDAAHSKNADPNKTMFVATNALYKPGTLVLQKGVCQPDTITLQRGVNTIGRKSNVTGEGLLDTADKYISKKHLHIDVVMKPDYSFEHRLSDAGSTNGTFHNGSRLEKDEIVVLVVGDRIRIGQTEFKLVNELTSKQVDK